MSTIINADTSDGLKFTSDTSGEIKLQSAGTDTVTVKSDGKVGIGTSSPYAKLDIVQENAGYGGWKYGASFDATDYPAIRFLAATANTGAIIGHEVASLVFLTGTTATAAGSERMRIDSSGNVLVGTTSADGIITAEKNGSNVITAKQTASGGWVYKSNAFNNGGTYYHIEFLDGGVSHGSITSNGTTTAYNTSSDYRLKENVAPMSSSIDRLKQLKPSTWSWKQGGNGEGFIAHEAQAVVPEAVTGTKDAMRTEQYEVTPAVLDDDGKVVTKAVMGTREVPEYQGIDQSKLVPLLTAALQEAITKIEDLETRIQALENA